MAPPRRLAAAAAACLCACLAARAASAADEFAPLFRCTPYEDAKIDACDQLPDALCQGEFPKLLMSTPVVKGSGPQTR